MKALTERLAHTLRERTGERVAYPAAGAATPSEWHALLDRLAGNADGSAGVTDDRR